MSSWKYIVAVVSVSIGGTLLFGYWALGQYDLAFNNFDASYNQLAASIAANTKLASSKRTATTTDSSTIATTTPGISLLFPAKNDKIYIGCKYKISWQPSTTTVVTSLGIALVDAGTKKPVVPTVSGLAATSTPLQSDYLDWKVGSTSPGEYYIHVSNINDQEITREGEIFTVKKLPKGERCAS